MIKDYVCLNCLRKTSIVYDIKTDDVNEEGVGLLNKDLHAVVMCFNCDDFMVDIDHEISDAIITLLKKGYKTYACCQGHIYAHGYVSTPYLIMSADELIYSTITDIINGNNNYREIFVVSPKDLDDDKIQINYRGHMIKISYDIDDYGKANESFEIFKRFIYELADVLPKRKRESKTSANYTNLRKINKGEN